MIAIVQHDHHRVGHPRLVWSVRLAALALVLLAGWWLHRQVGQLSRGPSMQRVRLLSPAAEPLPPEPEKSEPVPEDKLDKPEVDPNQPFDASAPQAPGEPGALGVDSEGDAGGDNFGLAAKPGGRELTTYPEGSGYGLGQGAGGGGGVTRAVSRLNEAFMGMYMRRLGARLEDQLARHDELRRAAWRAEALVTLDDRGVVRAVALPATLDAKIAGKLKDALLGLDTGEAPPRAGRPLKVDIRSRMEAARP